jgi:hypothetical protein
MTVPVSLYTEIPPKVPSKMTVLHDMVCDGTQQRNTVLVLRDAGFEGM